MANGREVTGDQWPILLIDVVTEAMVMTREELVNEILTE